MKWRSWALALHRDLGYFFAGVIVIYAVSGIAVNHADSWNPDFIVERREIALELPRDPSHITTAHIMTALTQIGEAEKYRSFDFPASEKIKIYLRDGDIIANLCNGIGTHETIRRRPLFHQVNMLHLNPKKWWLVFSDVFAVGLLLIALTGVSIPRGSRGLLGRGKWLIAAGLLVPLAAVFAI